MNTLKLTLAASLLASGLAYASSPCEGFEVKVKNNLADDLVVRKITLHGGDLQPNGLQKLNNKSEETFTVNNSVEGALLDGELVFNTISLPSKEVKIKFNLENKGVVCEHTDLSVSKDLELTKTRLPGKVQYTIGN